MPLGAHHLHAPVFACESWNRDPIVCVEERLRLAREIADEIGLLAGLDVRVLHLLDRLLPVVAESELARRLLHLAQRERILALRDGDELLGRVRNHLVLEIDLEPIGADGIADDWAVVEHTARVSRRQRRRRNPDDLLAQRARVPRHRRIELQVGRLRPPGEHRVVAVVVAVPRRDGRANAVKVVGRAVGDRARHLGRRRTRLRGGVGLCGGGCWRVEQRAHAVYDARRLRECACGRDGINGEEIAPSVLKREQLVGERQQRSGLAAHRVAAVHHRELVLQIAVEEDVVGLAFRVQLVEVDLAKAHPPRGIEVAQPFPLVRRLARVIAGAEGSCVDCVALDDSCQVARGARHQLAELGDGNGGVDGNDR